ncbi:hypothetical protein KAJ02_04880, partial [Candidatus Bipolaricaulota bacterium]|nr:hypothetical protein [Candidatus Bipolaricaulota bacterium]
MVIHLNLEKVSSGCFGRRMDRPGWNVLGRRCRS